MNKEDLIKPIYDYFVNSSDFNGIPMNMLFELWKCDWEQGILSLITLIREGVCIIQSSSNPHIIRYYIPSIEDTINYLQDILQGKDEKYLDYSECVYPSPDYLSAHRDISSLSTYESRLALGEPQLKPLFFNFEVLLPYKDDPRYTLVLNDYQGSLSYTLEKDTRVDKAGSYLLKTFGIGYDEHGIRVIVSFPRYLKELSPSQQNQWESNEITEACKVFKPYWDNVMNGCWAFPQSVATGVLKEREYINSLWKAIFNDSLFFNNYTINQLKPTYSFLFIPTQKSLNEFCHLMDKLFSDDLNTAHLRALLEKGYDRFHPVRATYDKNIGSLKALELWIDNIYVLKNGDRIGKEILSPLKKIRKLRQPEAHSILLDDTYDTSIYQQHNELLLEVYHVLKELRMILSTHPSASTIAPPEDFSEEVYSI